MMTSPSPCIPGYRFASFACWYGLQCAIDEKRTLSPRPIFIVKRFKNGKIRVTGGEVTFTADPGHLDRFYWLEKVSQ